jgi:3-phosphoshikimate 1-carboxyvinyltransferase
MKLRIQTCQRIRGTSSVPGDKSISHRALLLGGIAEGVSSVHNWLPAADCQASLNAMRALGVKVEQPAATEVRIHGVGLWGLRPPTGPIDCQGSGTTMRLLAGILAGQDFTSTLDGHAGLRRRPMERIAVPLREMGATVETSQGRPPLKIKGGKLRGIDYQLPVASAQVKSAVLLAGLYAEGATTIHQPGPARDHSELMLQARGVDLRVRPGVIELNPPVKPLATCSFTIPADFSSAAFLLVAALLVPDANLLLKGVGVNPTRTGLLDVLHSMGAHIEWLNQRDQGGEPVADLAIRSQGMSDASGRGQRERLHGTQIDGGTVVRMIDEFPILAVAATQAKGETVIRDARELRVKETDRIAAVVAELRALGAAIEEREDGFTVRGPTPLHGAPVDSHGDHRLAMALAVAGLVAEGETVIEGTQVIADSFPAFIASMRALGANLSQE